MTFQKASLQSPWNRVKNILVLNAPSSQQEGGLLSSRDFVEVHILSTKWFTGMILMLIFANTVFITLSTVESIEMTCGWYFTALDSVFMGLYLLELSLKLYVHKRKFFKNGWNNFGGRSTFLDAVLM